MLLTFNKLHAHVANTNLHQFTLLLLCCILQINLISRASSTPCADVASISSSKDKDKQSVKSLTTIDDNTPDRKCSNNSEDNKTIEQLPYVDESEDSSYKQTPDPLDLYDLKETPLIGMVQTISEKSTDSTNSKNLSLSPVPCVNGDSGIHMSDQEKLSPDLDTNNWTDDQNDVEELPERLI